MKCSIDKCSNKALCKGICKNHYMQQYRSSSLQKIKVKELWYKWHYRNEDKYKAQKEINRATDLYKNRVREYRKQKYHNDIEFRLMCVLRSTKRRALCDNNKAIELLGCSISELKAYIEAQFKPGMSWDNYGLKGWHLDHIKPLSKFDLTNSKHIKEACNYKNLQPLWAIENLRKSNRVNYANK